MGSDAKIGELRDWFEEHASFLYCWLRTRLNPRVRRELDAEDLLQEVWVRATKLVGAEPIGNTRSWLLRIAGYVMLEAVRGWQRRTRSSSLSAESGQVQLIDEVTSLTRRIARDEARQSFFAALDALDDDERLILVQHGMEGAPIAQVAPRLGIGTEAAGKRWQRLRDRLRALGSPVDLL
jgi:RNA polymerase sigma-70 factor (ECF subfamily)